MNPKVFIRNLGCPKNEVDGNVMAAYLKRLGCELVSTPSRADVLVVNTCGFIRQAKEESIDEILDLSRYKSIGRPKKLIVTGCLVQRYREELAAGIPEIDHFLGIGDLRNIANVIVSENGKRTYTGVITKRYQVHDVQQLQQPRSYAYIKISDGCDNMCSYCAIPSIRGRFRSRPIADIISEAEYHISNRVRELILIGQETTRYGKDTYGRAALPTLLSRLLEMNTRTLFRIMYAHPNSVTDDLIQVMASSPQIIPYLDLPLQHISDRMLKLMNRKVTSAHIRDLIDRLRSTVPNITLRTTYLIGHPGESSADFEKLLRFQEEFDIERVGVFGYSPEEGTQAYGRSGRVRENTISRRVDSLMILVQEQSLDRNNALMGSTQNVIIDGPASNGTVWGRLLSQAPEIDGNVLLDGSFRRGSIIKARVTRAEAYDLYAAAD
ncbi:MAG: 30S ribosomal protein S12 methylthiotransferase RimO [candidate division Zixibacteria bacterium]|nr:30S ribosomal protein S12 methylthiotransferase RimO [candidate division Zixibacteria bacterium]MBU1471109.1 30S ribosomal protein S12 methylthiotransferase RimO [candidate division Zixibacteria bacterium]